MHSTDLTTDLGTILSIWAHPDDETYTAGGLMAAARDAGQRVVCLTASAGERGSPDPVAWPPERLFAVRHRESAAAMAALGVVEHDIAGFPDGELSGDEAKGTAWARRAIEEVQPDTILTFGPDGITFHPDHVAVHHWVTRAWRSLGRPGRVLHAATSVDHLIRFGALLEEWQVYMGAERPTGVTAEEMSVRLHLRGAELDRKVVALRAMTSQTAAPIAALGLDHYGELVAEEAFVDATVDHAVST
jgi:LmbE family N-acetylglucosaminyl deacetylase